MNERAVVPCGRAAVFSVVCVALAAAAHSLASHAPVSAWACLSGLALVFVFARIVAVRERGLGAIAALMLACQAGLHLLFDSATGSVPVPMNGMAGMGPAAHRVPGAHVMTAAQGMPHLSPAMLAGHGVAALAVSWWLRRGEAGVFELAGRFASWAMALCRALLALAGGIVPPRMAKPSVVGRLAELPSPAVRLIRFAMVRRGPPTAGISV